VHAVSWNDSDALALYEYRRRKTKALPLADFVARTPGNERPDHLKPLSSALERAARGKNVRLGFSVPSQHGKSELVLHGLVWMLMRDPTKRHAFATYNDDFTRDQQKRARRIARQHRVNFTTQSTNRWETPEGGGILWTSRRGGITGSPVDGVIILDDLLKGRMEAQSPAIKREAMDFIHSEVLTRLHPGASVIQIATRWAIDDTIGQLERDGWETINLPAISDDGKALWPSKRPLAFLEQQRREMGEWDFAALFMGSPRPRGGTVFRDAHWYDALPEGSYREAVGLDLAYTAKSHADYAVAIRARQYAAEPDRIYILDMLRAQVEVSEFGARLVTWRDAVMHTRIGGQEKAVIQLLNRQHGLRISTEPAKTDKFTNAQPAAAAWNDGKVLLPRDQAWTAPLLDEVLTFTGVNDAHDDIIDALASAHHALTTRKPNDAKTVSRAYGW